MIGLHTRRTFIRGVAATAGFAALNTLEADALLASGPWREARRLVRAGAVGELRHAGAIVRTGAGNVAQMLTDLAFALDGKVAGVVTQQEIAETETSTLTCALSNGARISIATTSRPGAEGCSIRGSQGALHLRNGSWIVTSYR
ncbi:MAG TPA: hypothetical protein PLJ47_09790 [Candidatus Hydrogenedentes bacterium]|nr:hypothetical protein [Candidatus Hydrogenedentota bacterium]HRK34871.1 hypothetical protein [Candidatus Hydrogenedentota bacterium]